MKYYIKVEDGDRYETEYSDLKSALESLIEYQKEGWEGLVIEDENYEEYDTNDVITEIFFDMLAEEKSFEEIQKATGILKVEEDESQTVLTLHYPNGEIVSHWV